VRTGDSRKTRQSATDKSNTISTSTTTRVCVYACTREFDRLALLMIAFARCMALRRRRKAVSDKAQKG